jgi:hypothetical protein
MEEKPARRGISKEAWAAIGVIGAAVITGVVTLLTHIMPSETPAVAPTHNTSTTNSPAPSAIAPVVDAIVGKWEGSAQASDGTKFQITLDVTEGCALGQLCGSIGVSHVPCYGQIFLEAIDDDEVEFRVDNFDERSDLAVCQPGAGERFRSLPDGRLSYRTTYEPVAQGTLKRV